MSTEEITVLLKIISSKEKRKKKEKASFPLNHSKRHRVHDRGYWHVFNYIDKTNLHIQNKSTLLMQAKNLI